MDDDMPETCSLHRCQLVEDIVPLFYGFRVTSTEYGRAWRGLFRFSRSWSPGSCSMTAGKPTTELVQYCPKCRQAELDWLAQRISESSDPSSWEWFLAGCLGLRSDS